MSNKVVGAKNQQATIAKREAHIAYRHDLRLAICDLQSESSETIRQTPYLKEEILAYLNGALHDASRNKRTRIRFVQKYPEWLRMIQEMLAKIGCNSWIYKEGKNRNVYALETTCKELDFLFDPLTLRREQEKILYLRAFFDTEGGVPHNSGRFYIQFIQKHYAKIAAIKKLLNGLGIESGKIHNPNRLRDPNLWRLFVSSKHRKSFAKRVGSWHPVKQEILRRRMKI